MQDIRVSMVVLTYWNAIMRTQNGGNRAILGSDGYQENPKNHSPGQTAETWSCPGAAKEGRSATGEA